MRRSLTLECELQQSTQSVAVRRAHDDDVTRSGVGVYKHIHTDDDDDDDDDDV